MYRLTTPKHTFIFEIDPEETFETILITYAQNGQIRLEKTKDDLSFETEDRDGKTVYLASCRLTQEETQKFTTRSRNTVDIQVRAGTAAGEWFASDIQHLTVHDVLNDKVLP